MTTKTMFDKIWDAHVVREEAGQPTLLYVDLHLVHEVTSPQAFEGLRMTGRAVRRPDLTVATMDHNTPTWELNRPITDPIAAQQLDYLERSCREFGVTLYDRFSPNQGIVPRDRAGAGLHAARQGDRVRRQPYLDPRRVRRVRHRHRHVGGRARPRDPDAAPVQAEHHGDQSRGWAAVWRVGKGRHSRHHRRDRRRRRDGPMPSSTPARAFVSSRWKVV